MSEEDTLKIPDPEESRDEPSTDDALEVPAPESPSDDSFDREKMQAPSDAEGSQQETPTDNDKLRIPDPDEGQDVAPDTIGNIVLAGVLSTLLGLALFVVQRSQHDGSSSAEVRGDARTVQGETDTSRERIAARLADMGRDQLKARDWSERERVSAFRLGPRKVARAACRTLPSSLTSESLSNDVQRELLGAVDRRVEHTPWGCLLRYFLEDRIDSSLELASELESFWNEMRTFRASSSIVVPVVQDYRQSGDPPESESFRRWLRLCGLNFERPEGRRCRQWLQTRAPDDETRDLLNVVESHLHKTDALNPSYDLPLLLRGLAHLVQFGQPDTWMIEETDALPNYDADFRLGAVLYLCRFAQSSNQGTAEQAARALSEAANVSLRAVQEKLIERWQLACRKAFRANDDSDNPRAPLLDTQSGEDADTPNYSLQSVIEAGSCQVDPDKPRWYCASRQWRGYDADKLEDFFVETGHLKWDDDNEFWQVE